MKIGEVWGGLFCKVFGWVVADKVGCAAYGGIAGKCIREGIKGKCLEGVEGVFRDEQHLGREISFSRLLGTIKKRANRGMFAG